MPRGEGGVRRPGRPRDGHGHVARSPALGRVRGGVPAGGGAEPGLAGRGRQGGLAVGSRWPRRVTEKVKSAAPTAFGTLVYEERLVGTQTFRAAEDGDGQPGGGDARVPAHEREPAEGRDRPAVHPPRPARRPRQDPAPLPGRGRGRSRAQVGSVPGMAKEPRPLSGKVVAITGAARGIGLATARACAARGMKVAIGDLDEAEAKRAAESGAGGDRPAARRDRPGVVRAIPGRHRRAARQRGRAGEQRGDHAARARSWTRKTRPPGARWTSTCTG